MDFKEYQTKKQFDPTNKGIRRAIISELEENAEKGKIAVADFMRVSDQVYLFKEEEVKGYRIDCDKATDTTGYAPEDNVYYLQLQYRGKTYANVIYADTLENINDLIEAIRLSLEKGTGVKLTR